MFLQQLILIVKLFQFLLGFVQLMEQYVLIEQFVQVIKKQVVQLVKMVYLVFLVIQQEQQLEYKHIDQKYVQTL